METIAKIDINKVSIPIKNRYSTISSTKVESGLTCSSSTDTSFAKYYNSQTTTIDYGNIKFEFNPNDNYAAMYIFCHKIETEHDLKLYLRGLLDEDI